MRTERHAECLGNARRSSIFLAAAVFVSAVLACGPCLAAEIWVSDLEPEWRAVRHWPANDFLQLFEPNAPWKAARQDVKVFNLSLRFVLESPDAEFRLVLDALETWHIALSIQAQPLTATRSCGLGIESFGPPDEMARAAQRLKAFGATLDYVVMDEPLYFGHQYKGAAGKAACQFDLEQLSDNAAVKMRPLLEAFPAVRVGDVEPIGPGTPGGQWARDILRWHDLFASKAGKPVSFFDADIIWNLPGSAEHAIEAFGVLRTRPLSIGVIYHGDADAPSDVQWSRRALDEARQLEFGLHFKPDRILIESWNDRPREILPQTVDGTLTNLISQYESGRWRRP